MVQSGSLVQTRNSSTYN